MFKKQRNENSFNLKVYLFNTPNTTNCKLIIYQSIIHQHQPASNILTV